MSQSIRFDPIRLPPEAEILRAEVRAFLAEETTAGRFDPHTAPIQHGFDRDLAAGLENEAGSA